MSYWTDDRALDLEQRRLDAAQARAAERMARQCPHGEPLSQCDDCKREHQDATR